MPCPGKLRLVFNPADGGEPIDLTACDFKGKGVAMSMYNTDDVSDDLYNLQQLDFSLNNCTLQSISGFAHSSFKMALQKKMPLVCYLSDKIYATHSELLDSSSRLRILS